jgi:benzylsuccinate CoA-transferase BbsF subunit
VELARPPLLGEHTRSVLGELLGMREAEIDQLEAAGVFK